MQNPYKRVAVKAFAALAVIMVAMGGCGKAPVPVEIDKAQSFIEDLRGAGAPHYIPQEFADFQSAVADAELHLALERERFFLFRDLEKVYEEYRAVGRSAAALKAKTVDLNNKRIAKINSDIENWRMQVEIVKNLTNLMNEGRLARRAVTNAEMSLEDAVLALKKGDLTMAEVEITNASSYHKSAEKTISKAVRRYLDRSQIERWRRTAEAAVAESARTGGYALVILKLDRKMLVYKSGKLVNTYPIGLGKNGLSDKLYVGDKATPEGRYVVSRKNPRSRYYKALMFNYPNQEDRERFAWAKRKGLIPRGRGIGNNLEIHGGGPESVTEGCVSLDNPVMDKIYSVVGVNTPIVIVGTLSLNDLLTSVCKSGG